ncbi:MAG: pirin family protein [Bryobacteraceae bacterium]|nr:pirin family protein [Bryobacteraceae bacterium]
MIHTIPSHARHHSDFGWLSTRWHFSFDSYYDPNNVRWGALRVFNDDVVQPGQGFPTHGHRDMEIISYVLEGALEHKDSMGTRHVLRKGELQVMSAGSGITHSEYNASAAEPVHFLQLWILPRTKGAAPKWEQRAFEPRPDALTPVVSSGALPNTLTIDQDAAIYLGTVSSGAEVTHTTSASKSYVFVISGTMELNGQKLNTGDQARIEGESQLRICGLEPSRWMLLDLPD